ncbi:unnamed protein product [Gadus morhua 'NCC']
MLQRNLAAVLGALAEEAEIRKCPTAKGLYTFCGTYRFVASVYLQADVLPHLACLSNVFQKAHIHYLHIKEQVPVTIQTLLDIREAGQTPVPGSFLSRLHEDLEDLTSLEPLKSSMRLRGAGGGKMSRTSRGRHSGADSSDSCRLAKQFCPDQEKNKSQEELLTLLASEYDEWLDLYPCLSLLASIALIVPVSSVNCERDFSAVNRIKTDLRNRLQGEHLAACLRISINGPEPNEVPYDRALEFFFRNPRRIRCSDGACKLCT